MDSLTAVLKIVKIISESSGVSDVDKFIEKFFINRWAKLTPQLQKNDWQPDEDEVPYSVFSQ